MNVRNDFYALTDDEQSTRLAKLATAAATHWDGGFVDLQLVKYRENAVFSARCANGQRVAVRVHRPGYHSDSALASELYWMRQIGLSGAVEVPEVIPTVNGELFVRVADPAVPETRCVSVLGWLTGRPVGTSENGAALARQAATKLYYDAGLMAATLHNLTSTMTMPADFTRHAWDRGGLVGHEPLWGRFWEHPDLTATERELLQRARSAADWDLSTLDATEENFGLIHADFVPENLLVDDGVLKLIDFDDAGYGWHLFELATALYFNIGESHYTDITGSLMAGYRAARALPEEYEALLPLFLFLRGTTYVGWVQSRPGTETSKTLGPMLIERACALAEQYLASRAQPPAPQHSQESSSTSTPY